MTPIELLKFMLPDFLVEHFEVVSDQLQKLGIKQKDWII